MSWAIAGGLLTAILGILLPAVLCMRLLAYRTAIHASDSHVSLRGSLHDPASHYGAMSRLLARDDFEYLAAQPGYRPEIGRRLRKSHRRILRMYVYQLADDFRRIHHAARECALHAPGGHEVLVHRLVRQQIAFWWAIVRIELRLLAPGTVDFRRLVEVLESIRADLAVTLPESVA